MTISLPPKGNDAKVLGAYFSPLKVEALATPTMQVKVAEGAFWTADNEHQEFIGGTSPLLSAPGADAKWVLLTVTPNGAINLVDGTAGTSPTLPDVSLYKDELPLSAIFVGDTVTAITNDMIYDVRPMWQIPPDSVSQTQLNDFATITYVNNGLATKAATDGTAEANFTLNVGGGSINDSGIYVDRQAGPDVAIRFNELAVSGSPAVSSPQWEFTNDGATWNAIGVSEGNYYLKTELNAGALDFLYYQQNELTGVSGSGALDTRYYEQADADAAFSALGHTHLAAEITDLNAQVETINLITPVSGDVSLNIGDMLDVTDTASLASHLLVWDGVDTYRSRALTTDDLSDVDTTAAVVGDFLINNGGTFVNRPLLTADISDFTDANYVLITTDQDINGIKTFKDGIAVETILTVADPLIDINFGETGDGVGDGTGTSGIRVDRGFGVGGSPGVANNPAIFQWDENAGQWEAGIEGSLATVLTSTHTHTVSDITDFSTGVTAQLNVNNLNQSQDVVYAGLADKDHLSYNIAGQWENQPFSVDVTTELNANDLEELQDVSYAGVVAGEVLMWNASPAGWVNHLLVKADVSNFIEADYLHVTGNETKTGNLIIDGNFTTNAGAGTETRLKSEHVYVTDAILTLNADVTVDGSVPVAGIEINRGNTYLNTSLYWKESAGNWVINTATAGGALTESTIETVGHTHLVADITNITVSAAEINFLDGTTSDVQAQLDDKINRAGDTMDALATLTFNGGEVLGLPAVPSATGASSKEYVDAQITATGGDLTTHAGDMTVHLTADQNTLLDGLSLGSPSALSSDDINQLIGITGNVQVLLDTKTTSLGAPPGAADNLVSWDAAGTGILDTGVRINDTQPANVAILWTSAKTDATYANQVPGVANNFAKLDGAGQLVDSTIRLLDVGTAATDIWSASKIDTTKADKILPAANNNLATLDGTGNLGDSGVLVNDATNTTAVIWTADKIDTTKADKVVGTLNNFITLDASSELQDSGLILNDAGVAATDLWSADKIDTTKMDKAGGSPGADGNFAEFDGTGNVIDSGVSTATFAPVVHTHTASDVTDFDTAADARIAAASLADLADVLITPSALDLLQWNGAAWVNGTVANIVGTDFVLKSGDTITGDLVIGGDLTVNGTTTILDTINLEVTDKNITLNAGYAGPTSGSTGSGLHVNRNDSGGSPAVLDLATLIWNDADERWEAGLEGAEQTLAVEGATVAQPLYEMQQALEGSPLGSPTTTIAVFTLGFGVPTPAAGTTGIQVFVNGVKQIEGAGKAYTVDYSNPSSTVVTFNSGQEPTVAADVEFYGFGYIT